MNNGKTVICEVGVGPLSMCYGALIWDDPRVEYIGFEPHPEYYRQVLTAAAGRPNVQLHNIAIGDEDGRMNLCVDGTSSALENVNSPFFQLRGSRPEGVVCEVDVRKMSRYDNGKIDVLRIDTEGAEYLCLKHLISRPKQIVIEMYDDMASYINPYLYDIEKWAKTNGYKKIAIHDSDFIYER